MGIFAACFIWALYYGSATGSFRIETDEEAKCFACVRIVSR
jgi:hypothetical protein